MWQNDRQRIKTLNPVQNVGHSLRKLQLIIRLGECVCECVNACEVAYWFTVIKHGLLLLPLLNGALLKGQTHVNSALHAIKQPLNAAPVIRASCATQDTHKLAAFHLYFLAGRATTPCWPQSFFNYVIKTRRRSCHQQTRKQQQKKKKNKKSTYGTPKIKYPLRPGVISRIAFFLVYICAIWLNTRIWLEM